MFHFLTNFLRRKAKSGCPVCLQPETVAFAVGYLGNGARIVSDMEIDSIKVYRCLDCHNQFIEHETMFNKIMGGQLELLKTWSQRELVIPTTLKRCLEEIGLTENWNNIKEAPCTITLKDGRQFTLAKAQISKQPPVGYLYSLYKHIFFIDEVDTITSNDFALSKEIRLQTLKAEERRMGFYPTVVKTKAGVKAVVNGPELFFKHQDIKGSELEPTQESWDHLSTYLYSEELKNKTLVLAKA